MTRAFIFVAFAMLQPHAGGVPARVQDPAQSAEQVPGPSVPAGTAPAPTDAPVRHKKQSLEQPVGPMGQPAKTVVRNGGAYDLSVEFAPTVPKEKADQESRNAKQFLSDAESSLKVLSERIVSGSQQETISHVKNYMSRAQTALDSGDIERAYKLAVKAAVLTRYMVNHPDD